MINKKIWLIAICAIAVQEVQSSLTSVIKDAQGNPVFLKIPGQKPLPVYQDGGDVDGFTNRINTYITTIQKTLSDLIALTREHVRSCSQVDINSTTPAFQAHFQQEFAKVKAGEDQINVLDGEIEGTKTLIPGELSKWSEAVGYWANTAEIITAVANINERLQEIQQSYEEIKKISTFIQDFSLKIRANIAQNIKDQKQSLETTLPELMAKLRVKRVSIDILKKEFEKKHSDIRTLLHTIIKNPSNYDKNFVNKMEKIAEPFLQKTNANFIKLATDLLGVIGEAFDMFNKQDSSLTLDNAKEVLKFINNHLQQLKKDKDYFFKVANDIQNGALRSRIMRSANPVEIENALELCRAVKIEQNQMIARALELSHAVKE